MRVNKPNILFVMVDQLSAKWLERPHRDATATPAIDRLRSMGTWFSNAITSNPVCCPARATIATGLSSRGHGVLQNGYELDPALPTFMQLLQQNGWRTGAFGKIHFRAHFHGLHHDYRAYGFDVVHNTEDSRGGEWLDWVAKMHPQHFDSVLATIWSSHIPEFAAYGPEKVNLKQRIEEIRKSFPWPPGEIANRFYALPFPQQISQTEWITDHALRFIHDSDPDQPIYAHISYVQPHGPSSPPAEYLDRVDCAKISPPVRPEWQDDPHAPEYFKLQTASFTGEALYRKRQYYYADLMHLDEQIGRILDALAASGRLDNSYLVFLSDHGELLGDHGFTGKEERHYDACIRVPLILVGAGIPAGDVCDAMVQLEDVFPTVLDMASLPSPRLPKIGPYLKVARDNIPYYPGKSLLELCSKGGAHSWRQAAYCESYNALGSVNPMDWARTIRTKEYRYTMYPRGGGEQLFDLRSDQDELQNVVTDGAYQTVRDGLRAQLLEAIILQDYPWTPRELFSMGVH